MKTMRTLTVNGQTYIVEDGQAVSFSGPQDLTPQQQQQARDNIGVVAANDNRVGANTWSSKKTVDKLCPAFMESGTVVTCNPVEGYPLEVVSHLKGANPNLLPDGSEWETEESEDMRSGYLYLPELPEGDYTLHTTLHYIPLYIHSCDEDGRWYNIGPIIGDGYNELGTSIENFTFTAYAGHIYRVSYDFNRNDYKDGYFEKDYSHEEILELMCLKLERGTQYTAVTSVKLTQENGTDTRVFTIDLGQAVFGGSFNWTTGVLTDHNGNTHQLPVQEIPALPGVNTLYSDRGDTAVAGAGVPMTVDDTVVSANPWSSKNTVDKLCPTFTESGTVVACEPVEGYPLEVTAGGGATITRCGKNLIDPTEYMQSSSGTTLDGDVFTTTFEDGGLHVNRYSGAKHHPAGTYTVTVVPVSESVCLSVFVYDKETGEEIARLMNVGMQNRYTLTFTAPAAFRVSIGGPNAYAGGVYGTYSYKLQLEKGTTATAYEPYRGETFQPGEPITALPGVNTIYADKGNVTVTGKADPGAIINKLCDKVNALTATITALTGV